MDIAEISAHLAVLLPIVTFIGSIIGIVYFKTLSSINKNLTVYLILLFIADIASRIIRIDGSNFIILPLYSLLELCFFIWFYNNVLLNKRRKGLMLLGFLGIMYIIAEIVMYFIFNEVNTKQFQPYAKVVDNFIIIIMALYFYLEKIKSFKDVNWKLFRMNTILLSFFTLNVIVFLPFNFLVNENTGLKYYFWLVNIISLILFQMYIVFSIWQNARQQKIVQTK